MRIMFRVLKRPIKYILDNCKEKIKSAMKNIIKEIICCGMSIFKGYNENVTCVTPCKAINELSKITFCAFWIALSDDINILNI